VHTCVGHAFLSYTGTPDRRSQHVVFLCDVRHNLAHVNSPRFFAKFLCVILRTGLDGIANCISELYSDPKSETVSGVGSLVSVMNLELR
jgi:hypothetical protein